MTNCKHCGKTIKEGDYCSLKCKDNQGRKSAKKEVKK